MLVFCFRSHLFDVSICISVSVCMSFSLCQKMSLYVSLSFLVFIPCVVQYLSFVELLFLTILYFCNFGHRNFLKFKLICIFLLFHCWNFFFLNFCSLVFLILFFFPSLQLFLSVLIVFPFLLIIFISCTTICSKFFFSYIIFCFLILILRPDGISTFKCQIF